MNVSEKHPQAGPNAGTLPATLGSRMPGSKIAILVPHNDDEVVGCWHFMETLAPCSDITIFVVTMHEGDLDLTQKRRAETSRAISGVGTTDIVHWDLPDGKVSQNIDQLEKLIGGLSDRWDFVLSPAPNDKTLDHIPIATVAQSLIPSKKLVWYRSTWWTFRLSDADLVLTGPQKSKIMALKKFQTQSHISLARSVWYSSVECLFSRRKFVSAEAFVLAEKDALVVAPFNSISLRYLPCLLRWL